MPKFPKPDWSPEMNISVVMNYAMTVRDPEKAKQLETDCATWGMRFIDTKLGRPLTLEEGRERFRDNVSYWSKRGFDMKTINRVHKLYLNYADVHGDYPLYSIDRHFVLPNPPVKVMVDGKNHKKSIVHISKAPPKDMRPPYIEINHYVTLCNRRISGGTEIIYTNLEVDCPECINLYVQYSLKYSSASAVNEAEDKPVQEKMTYVEGKRVPLLPLNDMELRIPMLREQVKKYQREFAYRSDPINSVFEDLLNIIDLQQEFIKSTKTTQDNGITEALRAWVFGFKAATGKLALTNTQLMLDAANLIDSLYAAIGRRELELQRLREGKTE